VHITKTAGTSIEAALTDYWKPEDQLDHNVRSISYPEDYYRFTAIRNTYLRVISNVVYTAGGWDENIFNKACKKALNANYKNDDTGLGAEWAPADWFLLDQNGKMTCQDIIRMDTLQEDFDIVCKKIGIPSSKVPRLNKSNKYNPYEYLTPRRCEMIETSYAGEIALFGWKRPNDTP